MQCPECQERMEKQESEGGQFIRWWCLVCDLVWKRNNGKLVLDLGEAEELDENFAIRG